MVKIASSTFWKQVLDFIIGFLAGGGGV